MAAQKILFKKYRDSLLQEVKDEIELERYAGDTFDLPAGSFACSRNVIAPLGLAEKMDPADDFKSAVALYEAFKDIPTIVAGNPVFWETLAHDELFGYVKKRWPGKEDNTRKNILNHWFVTKGMMRHSLAGLWWAVKCSYDKDAADPYALTRIIFKNYSFRTTFYGQSTFIRSKEATLGILSFLNNNPDAFTSMELAGRFITVYFNRLGATKQLACLDREFFSAELERIKADIINLKNREDIMNSINIAFENQYGSEE